ncbi:hypothetical protein EJB05_11899, partial [Eragrostis curvula]
MAARHQMRTRAMARGRRSETHLPYSRPPGTDRISDLPDELLHAILARLRSADAAARTSILSRRWLRRENSCMSPGCSCKWLERIHKVELDALEEVEVQGPGKADDIIELVRQLCNTNVTHRKRMTITGLEDGEIEYIRKEILSMCLPNDNLEIMRISPKLDNAQAGVSLYRGHDGERMLRANVQDRKFLTSTFEVR